MISSDSSRREDVSVMVVEVADEHRYARSRRPHVVFGLLTLVPPLLGVVAAAALLATRGITTVELGLFLGMYVLGYLGMSVGLHRYFAHRAFKTSRPVCAALAILGSFCLMGPPIFWAAVHRRHHAFTDRDGDPHSPVPRDRSFAAVVRGLWHGHCGWFFSGELARRRKYASDLLDDPLVAALDRRYWTWVVVGLLIPAALGGLLTGTWSGALGGFVWGGLVRVFCVNHATYLINSVCHAFGRRDFSEKGQSRNSWWLALPTLGESWHNNHHAFPRSATNHLLWWQVDLSYLVIRALERLGLVWDVWTPTAEQIRSKRRP